jgi:hypothetical protein
MALGGKAFHGMPCQMLPKCHAAQMHCHPMRPNARALGGKALTHAMPSQCRPMPVAWQWGGMALGQHGVAMHVDGMGR